MMKMIPYKARISIMLTSFILGVLTVAAFTAQERTVTRPTIGRKKELIETVKRMERERRTWKKRLARARSQMIELDKKTAASQGLLASFSNQIEQAESDAGLREITEPGIAITLADSLLVPPGKDPINYIVHDYDLRAVVNALWGGGAEAVSINGQRLISNSSIRCVGTTIMINSVRLGSPYEIKAVGKPEDLKKALGKDVNAAQVINDLPRIYGLIVKIVKEKELQVPAYSGSLGINYARTVNE